MSFACNITLSDFLLMELMAIFTHEKASPSPLSHRVCLVTWTVLCCVSHMQKNNWGNDPDPIPPRLSKLNARTQFDCARKPVITGASTPFIWKNFMGKLLFSDCKWSLTHMFIHELRYEFPNWWTKQIVFTLSACSTCCLPRHTLSLPRY